MPFFVGQFRPLSTRISRLGNNRYVQYYVQLSCQTSENRQKYLIKPLNMEDFTRFYDKKVEEFAVLQDIFPGFVPTHPFVVICRSEWDVQALKYDIRRKSLWM